MSRWKYAFYSLIIMGLWWQLCGNPFSPPSVFLAPAAGLTVRGQKKRRLTLLCKHSSRMRSSFQDAHAALTLTLQGVDESCPLRHRGFGTSRALGRQAAGLYNFSNASSDISFTPSVASQQPDVCFCLHSNGCARYSFHGQRKDSRYRVKWTRRSHCRNKRLQMGKGE